MSSRVSTSPSPSHHGDDGRKRVAKACDRCRLKKIKCDGKVPCGRCKHEAAICKFGDRKKTAERRVPPGYVEYLEDTQKTFVEAVKTLHRQVHMLNGNERRSYHEPHVHVIMEELDLVDHEARSLAHNGQSYRFAEDPEEMRAQFEEQYDSASAASGSPQAIHETQMPGRRHTTMALTSTPDLQQSSMHSSPSTQTRADGPSKRERPNMSLGPLPQGMTAFDTVANLQFPRSNAVATSRQSLPTLPTPQPSAGMDDSLWNDTSFFPNTPSLDMNMSGFNYDYDMNEAQALGALQQRISQQGFGMSQDNDYDMTMRWAGHHQ